MYHVGSKAEAQISYFRELGQIPFTDEDCVTILSSSRTATKVVVRFSDKECSAGSLNEMVHVVKECSCRHLNVWK